MQTLKRLSLAAILTLGLAGLTLGTITAFAPSDAVIIADSSGQRGDLDAG